MGGRRKQRQRQENISSFAGFSLAALNLKRKYFEEQIIVPFSKLGFGRGSEKGTLEDGNGNVDARGPMHVVLHFKILLQMTGHQGRPLHFLFG